MLGQETELARKLLDAAEQLGYSRSVVRTGEDGFYVPNDVVDVVYPPQTKKKQPVKEDQP